VKKVLAWLVARAKERSTWIGLATIVLGPAAGQAVASSLPDNTPVAADLIGLAVALAPIVGGGLIAHHDKASEPDGE
jgi:hypothetical protein